MPKALIIAKVKTAALERGRPDLDDSGIAFVHCSSAFLPGDYQAFVVTGTGAQLTAISNHANFVVGQQITKQTDEFGSVSWNWDDGRIAISGQQTVNKINNYLTNNGLQPLQAGDSVVTLIQRFNPGFVPGDYDVADPTLL